MSTATLGHTLDISGSTPTPFLRLVRVEMRKTWDTRAGFWLLMGMALLTAAVMVIQMLVGVINKTVFLTYNDFLTSTSFSISILLPVLGILLLTSEWSQRTAMTTFALEPRRSLVIMAKVTVGLVLALVAVAVALVLATICNFVYGVAGSDPVVWDASIAQTSAFALLQILGILTGFAFATLLLNSPAAIVLYMVYNFVLPGLFGLGAHFMHWFERLQPWVDFNYAQGPLVDASMTGKDWAHFAVAGTIWLVIPLGIGFWRVLRAEVK